jgi:hypothetical protein
MPDIFYKTVTSITQPARLVEVSIVTTKIETTLVAIDGTEIPQEPTTSTKIVEKWSIKAMVDTEWVGITEEEFFFPTKADCGVITPGYRKAF